MKNQVTFNAEKLKEARGQRPQSAVARELGISRQLLKYYESGGWPSVEKLVLLMSYFKLQFGELVVSNKPRES